MIRAAIWMISLVAVLIFSLGVAESLQSAPASEARIIGWSTRIVHFNSASGYADAVEYLYRVKAENEMLEFRSDQFDFRLGDSVQVRRTDDRHIEVKTGAKAKNYTLTGDWLQ